MSLSERDAAVIWHPYTQMQLAGAPIAIVSGEGAELIADNGDRYIDGISSWWVNIHGHAHPYIAEKVAAQLRQLEHVIFAGFTHEPAVSLAERLLKILPSNQSRVFYSDNGSTAVEVALKMALQYWYNKGEISRDRIMAFSGSYHGDTFGAMSVSERNSFTRPFNRYLFDVDFLPVPVKGQEEACISQLEKLLENDKIAAIIFEPLLMGTAGMVMYAPEVLDQIISLCRAKGVLVIADEVLTGFGRTGKLFASDYLAEQPDMMCLSKGLTGGTMALGVTTCTNQVYGAFLSDERVKMLFHGHSYTANPVACSAALASLDLLLTDESSDNRTRINQHHLAFRDKLIQSPLAANVRVLGTVLAFECITGEGQTYFSSLRDWLYDFFINEKIILRPLGNTVYFLPPYCITNEQLDKVYDAIEKMLHSLAETQQ